MAATEWRGRNEIGGGMASHLLPGQMPLSLLDCRSQRPPDAVVAVFRPHVAALPRATRGMQLPDWRSLEARLHIKFKTPTLLKQALIHTSYLNENPGIDVGSNERMEFLGDAALGVVVAQQLYLEYPDVDEGKLTELRAHLVRRDTLARAAMRLELGEYLQLGRGEDAAGGRNRPTNMARAYEALVGAIFLDGGIAKVRTFVKKSLALELAALREIGMPYDPKSKLQEVVQSRWQTTPSYKLLRTEGPDHARRFTVQVMVGGESFGSGEGRSKQMAEKQAAQQALEEIEKREGELVVP